MEVGDKLLVNGQVTTIDHIDEVEEVVLLNPAVIVPGIEYRCDNISIKEAEEYIKEYNNEY